MNTSSGALVLFSGGQDSTICLAWALGRYTHVETIGFDYGQSHAVEMQCRAKIREALRQQFPDWSRRLQDDHVLQLDALKTLSETALTRDMAIAMNADGLPNTFVPGRNLLFLVYAAALGYRRSLSTLVGGMCETDYSGYPDCREETLKSLAHSVSLGMDRQIIVETPLMRIDKAGTWAMAETLGGQALVELIREETHTCYRGDRKNRQPWGYGCNACPACALRKNGYETWMADRPQH